MTENTYFAHSSVAQRTLKCACENPGTKLINLNDSEFATVLYRDGEQVSR